jgi:hypothetical protein
VSSGGRRKKTGKTRRTEATEETEREETEEDGGTGLRNGATKTTKNVFFKNIFSVISVAPFLDPVPPSSSVFLRLPRSSSVFLGLPALSSVSSRAQKEKRIYP